MIQEPAATTRPTPDDYDPLAEAKLLLRVGRAASLATLTAEGAPFATLVNIATAPDGAPILLMSRLAAHTRQLERDPRLSLLIVQTGEGDPLAHPRLTVSGRAARAEDADARDRLRARFLARHPKSALYADFGDFSFWRVEVALAHLNGGFGRTGNFNAATILTSVGDADALLASEQGALAHMNADHADALALYAAAFTGKSGADWVATGLDPEGLDLMRGDEAARIVFPRRAQTPGELRAVLVELAEVARELLQPS
ncbi:pyridoxamine 5'-phosphate oxidase-related FMN-binding [Methylocella silvestris BL2]|uniref:Pyridoxamine 5'-phosphate oxidase-related FMN-binding n=1 Tax=Methylocella silvestris (strain DSM 15510 / CIP 108128 / LMG 27833 / NCIMB 13906 / BL2) TaxID=395965 RepID=B8ERF5_METSB|nr:DUF2470 domain-containing protein [Methylocella silvestris]ACK50339.1 pyridoxamine 5'-phosphate oxidase-related FMN-binding [Methylocella silvestris BL2]